MFKLFLDQIDHDYLQSALYILLAYGFWPIKFENNRKLTLLYRYYAYFIVGYFLVFVASHFLELFIFIMEDAGMEKIMLNLCMIFYYLLGLIRMMLMKRVLIKKYPAHIKNYELELMANGDEDLIQIYRLETRRCKRINTILAAVFAVIAAGYVTHSYLDNLELQSQGLKRYVPYKTWLPIDMDKYYYYAFSLLVLDALIVSLIPVAADCLIINLMLFPVAQLKILSHCLRNFRLYADNFARTSNLDPITSTKKYIKRLVCAHKDIISFSTKLSDDLNIMFLLDFCMTLVHFTFLLFMLITSSSNTLKYAELLFCFFVQIYSFYWNANEIILTSVALSDAIWEGEWYLESVPVQKSLLIMMIRSKISLGYWIGRFKPLAIGTVLAILKMSYSAGTVLKQTYDR